jgi:hypothetical protein
MSEKTQHTPGPWEHVKAERLSHDAVGYEQILSPGGILGGASDDPAWVIEGQIDFTPDARLIAAAPELLAFAKAHDAYMLDAGYSGPDSDALHPKAAANWRACRAALSKATGQ